MFLFIYRNFRMFFLYLFWKVVRRVGFFMWILITYFGIFVILEWFNFLISFIIWLSSEVCCLNDGALILVICGIFLKFLIDDLYLKSCLKFREFIICLFLLIIFLIFVKGFVKDFLYMVRICTFFVFEVWILFLWWVIVVFSCLR